MPKTPKQIIRMLKKDGWYQDRSKGSHRIFKHPTKKGTISVPYHNKDLNIGTEKQILEEAGIGGK